MSANARRVISSSPIGAMAIITTDCSGDRTQIVGQLSHSDGSDGTSAGASLMVCQPAHALAERQVLCDGFGALASLVDDDVEDVAAPHRGIASDEDHAHRGELLASSDPDQRRLCGPGICSAPKI